MGGDLNAGVPFYGRAPADAADVAKIKAPLLIQYAEDDKRVNAMRPDFEAALKANNKDYQMFTYPGTRHGFHNNSTARYNEAAANHFNLGLIYELKRWTRSAPARLAKWPARVTNRC